MVVGGALLPTSSKEQRNTYADSNVTFGRHLFSKGMINLISRSTYACIGNFTYPYSLKSLMESGLVVDGYLNSFLGLAPLLVPAAVADGLCLYFG